MVVRFWLLVRVTALKQYDVLESRSKYSFIVFCFYQATCVSSTWLRMCSSAESTYYDLNKRKYKPPRKHKGKPDTVQPIQSVLKPAGVTSPEIDKLDQQLSSLDKLISDINLRISEQKGNNFILCV